MPEHTVDEAKDEVRRRVWGLLDRAGATTRPSYGRIPAFQGAQEAADRLASLPVWASARTLKTVPDRAQLPVRARALAEGRLVFMAVPNLAGAQPFYRLDPARLPGPAAEAAEKNAVARWSDGVSPEDMPPIDLVVCGSVAVNAEGVRLGKGGGFSDIEVALLVEAGLLTERTTIVTTVHDLQVVDEPLPEAEHDFRVDLIVTPEQVITCPLPKRPAGLDWSSLDTAKVAAIPFLAARTRHE